MTTPGEYVAVQYAGSWRVNRKVDGEEYQVASFANQGAREKAADYANWSNRQQAGR